MTIDPITVRWTWGLPPFHAYYVTRQGLKRGVVRWTPWAARWRAYELWLDYVNLMLHIAREDYRRGQRESADEIRAWIEARLNNADPDIWVTTESINRARGKP